MHRNTSERVGGGSVDVSLLLLRQHQKLLLEGQGALQNSVDYGGGGGKGCPLLSMYTSLFKKPPLFGTPAKFLSFTASWAQPFLIDLNNETFPLWIKLPKWPQGPLYGATFLLLKERK